VSVSDEELDRWRERGDDALDAAVAELGSEAVRELLGELFRTTGMPRDARVVALLQRLPALPVADPQRVEHGQNLFQLFGPEILLVLGCYALPAAYAASNGVQVIYRSRRMADDGLRRLCETAQMMINVMVPGGLAPGGIGERSALKVRLMHALIRAHVARDGQAWSSSWGLPINQEDLAGTLLTFSLVVIDGLRKMGAQVSPQDEQGYFTVWHHIGKLLGIDARLIPGDYAAAVALAARIAARQLRPSPEGKKLARDLVQVNDSLFPVPGYGLSLMHFFLESSIFGINLAGLLDLPAPNWTRLLVRGRAAQKRLVFDWLERVPGARQRRRVVAGFFTQRLILLQRPDKRSPFELPPGLWARWRLRARVAPGRVAV